MQLDMKKVYKLISLLIFVSSPVRVNANIKVSNYPFKKESVWRAALIALATYPLDISNFDQGQIKTKNLTEGEFWTPRFRQAKDDHKYTIELNIFEDSKGTKVTLEKQLKRAANFNTNEKALKTKNVEEDLILYRIKRELIVDRTLKKNF